MCCDTACSHMNLRRRCAMPGKSAVRAPCFPRGRFRPFFCRYSTSISGSDRRGCAMVNMRAELHLIHVRWSVRDRATARQGAIGEQVRCERVRDPPTGWAAPAVRGPLAGGGPQPVKVVHHQEARRQLPGRAGPRCPDGPGVRSADRRAGRMESTGTRDCHLVPGGHRVRRDEMAVPGRPLPG